MRPTKQIQFETFFTLTGKIKRFMDHKSGMSLQDRMTSVLQLQALQFIDEHPETTVGIMAKELLLSSSSIAQLLDRLLSSEWIERHHDQKDKRVVRLVLTQEGKKQLSHLKQLRTERLAELLPYIPEKDVAELVRIMESLITTIEKKGESR
ncbi:MarR family winged helix-turn-helix transcriptional regulator [soil metagenome]